MEFSPCLLASVSHIGDAGMVENVAHTFGVQWNLLLAQILNFCLVAYLLYLFALKPVLKTIEERQKAISDGLQYAEEMKTQLVETEKKRVVILEEAQEEAKKWLEKTKQDSTNYFQSQRNQAEEQAEALIKQAQHTIEQERVKMFREVRAELVGLVVTTTEQVLRKHLTDQEKDLFSQRALEDLATASHKDETSA